ncbi:MAG: type II toxin-antitoxin system death-on-curing family toxin [Nitrososphaerota archaeon]
MAKLSEQGLLSIHKVIEQKYPLKLKGVQYPNKIKDIVERPHLVIFGHEPYNTIFKKAACLMEAIIRGHAFYDGNKRTGLMTTFAYLQSQGYYLAIPIEIVKYTVDIATHQSKTEEEINDLISEISIWLERHSSRTYLGYTLKVIRYTSLPSIGMFILYFIARKYANRKIDEWYQLTYHEDYVEESIKDVQKLITNSVQDSINAILNKRKMKRLNKERT